MECSLFWVDVMVAGTAAQPHELANGARDGGSRRECLSKLAAAVGSDLCCAVCRLIAAPEAPQAAVSVLATAEAVESVRTVAPLN